MVTTADLKARLVQEVTSRNPWIKDSMSLRLAGVCREQTSRATKMEDWAAFPFLLWFC
jgi:hypothetical protein